MCAGRLLIILVLILPPTLWAMEIRHVQHDTAYLHESGKDQLNISFEITEPASVTLNIYDARDLLIRSIDSDPSMEKGRHTLRWDGKDNLSVKVPAGIYRYTIDAKSTADEIVTYDLSELTGGNNVRVREIKWNEKKHSVDYILPGDSLVGIRIGLENGGPLMKTLLDWEPRRGGANSEKWDGFDSSGVINLGKHPRRVIGVTAFRLSDNSIIVGSQFKPNWIDVSKWGKTRRPIAKQTGRKKALFKNNPYRQPAESRGDIQLQLTIPDSIPKNKEGLAEVKGKVPFLLDVVKKDKQRALARRFEAIFFVDGIKVFENEIGFLPMTWYWDTHNTNPGVHYITANLIGYEGNFGLETIKLTVLPREISQ